MSMKNVSDNSHDQNNAKCFSSKCYLFIFKRLFIYLFDRDRHNEREHKHGEWKRERQAPCQGEADRRPDPRTLEP